MKASDDDDGDDSPRPCRGDFNCGELFVFVQRVHLDTAFCVTISVTLQMFFGLSSSECLTFFCFCFF